MKEKKEWLTPKTIRFDRNKLALAKKNKTLGQLPELCRKQLEILSKKKLT